MRNPLLLAAFALALLATPAAAEEPTETVVPPGNSAVDQYTQTLPSAGGGKHVEDSGGRPTANQVLGAGNVEKLKRHGSAGEAVTEIVVETAPVAEPEPEPASEPPAEREAEADRQPQASDGEDREAGAGAPAPADRGGSGGTPTGPIADPSGESGLSAVLGEATGATSSGQLGLLLPLVILGGLVWAIVFVARRPRETAS